MFKRHIDIKDVDKYRIDIFTSKKQKTKGIIRYNPARGNLKNNQSCCILELDSGIADYYRHQVNKYYGIDLVKPSWKSHVSIITGEDASMAEQYHIWCKYEGKEVEIAYYPYPRYSGDTDNKYGTESGWFWFLTVESEFFNEIRSEFLLPNIKNPHLTIGRNRKK
jgi:hypothetical protein